MTTKATNLSALGSNVTTAGNLSSANTLTLETNGATAITIDSSQRTAFVAGTAAAPAITRIGDTNTGMFFPAADTIAFAEGGTESMRLDSLGNLGIGVTPSPSVLSGKVLEIGFSGGNANMFQNGVDDWWFSSNAYYNGTSWVYNKTGTISQYHMFNGTHVWLNQVSGTAGTPASAPVERMRIDANGNVLIGTTTSPAGSKELVLGGDYIEGVVTIGPVTTSNTLSLANGTFQTATLTASTACTFTMPTAIAGKSFTLLIRQASTTGNGTVIFTNVRWPAGVAPTMTATAGRIDIFTFMSDGINWYGSFNQNYTP